MLSGWRGLGMFWAAVLLLLGGTAVVLQVLGPPPLPPAPPARLAASQPAPAVTSVPSAPLVTSHRDVPPADHPGRDTPGAIADPDPALLEPGPGASGDSLPRVAEDGRRPMQVYASGFDRSTRRSRVGILVAGIGLNEEDSNRAIRDLPRGVTLAVSPYGTNLPRLLVAARLAEHEYLLSIPMEPQGFPANDPGPRALMSGLSNRDNLDRLRWLLAHVQGYVGVTNALGAMRGERFSGMAEQMDPVLTTIGERGLLFVDARPAETGGAPTQRHAWSRDVDMVLDEPPEDLDVRLAQLEALAHEKGEALGLVGAPSPVAVQHLAAWCTGLLDRGLALAPVSALVVPPADVVVSTR